MEKSSFTPSQNFECLIIRFRTDLEFNSSPGRSPARQAASRTAHSHEKDTRDSEGIAVLSGTDQFLRTVSRSWKTTHATNPALASLPLGSLPLLHRSTSAGNPLIFWK